MLFRSEDKPGLQAARLIRHEQGDALRRVAGRMEDLDDDIPQSHFLPVSQRREIERHVGRLVQAVRGARFRRQCSAPGDVIGLDVGIDSMRDFHPIGCGELDVTIDIVLLRVYDRRQALAASPKGIRRTTGFVIEELLVNHAPPPPLRLRGPTAITVGDYGDTPSHLGRYRFRIYASNQ